MSVVCLYFIRKTSEKLANDDNSINGILKIVVSTCFYKNIITRLDQPRIIFN